MKLWNCRANILLSLETGTSSFVSWSHEKALFKCLDRLTTINSTQTCLCLYPYYMHAHVYVYMWVCARMCACVSGFSVCFCVCVCTCVFMCACPCMDMDACACVHTFVFSTRKYCFPPQPEKNQPVIFFTCGLLLWIRYFLNSQSQRN